MIDNLTIHAQGGNGGNGSVAFRRERYVPKGGPNGGDGGRGGDVLLKCDPSVRSLDHLRHGGRKRAQNGSQGEGNEKHGRRGADLVLSVPIGTVAYQEADGSVLGDLTEPGQTLIVAKGGRGGRGNKHFATSVHKTPRFAEEGEPGEETTVRLEVRTLADVGIVGLPNVGKSSILAAVSRARPRIGAFAFSTLEPELGVVEREYERLFWMDIPGLLEGASEGVGMGEQFLQHIMRTRVLVHVLTGDSPDVRHEVETVERELEAYNPELLERPRLFAVNKMDLAEAAVQREAIRRSLAPLHRKVVFVSAATGEGLDDLVAATFQLAAQPAPQPHEEAPAEEPETEHVFRPLQDNRMAHAIHKEDGVYVLEGRYLPRVVVLPYTPVQQYRQVLRERLRRTKWRRVLEQAGVKPGDKVRIGDTEVEW